MSASPAEYNRRVLVIDDNRAIHEDFRKILAPDTAVDDALAASAAALFGDAVAPAPEARFEIASAHQGLDGVALAERAVREGRPFALAFVDVRMPPGLDGLETTRRLWQADPHLQVVICTAYSDYSWRDLFGELGRPDQVVILKKPFDAIEALQLAHALTAKWSLALESRQALEKLEVRVVERTGQLTALAEKHQIAAAVIDSAAEGVMVTDAGLRIEAVNPAFERITGFSAAQAVGQTPRILWSGRHDAEFFRSLRGQLHAQGSWRGEIWNRRHGGELYPQDTSINVLRDAEGRIRHFASVFSDSTARHELEARLRALSSMDGLTGVTNRRTFDEALAAEWARALRDRSPLSLLIADVDHFKRYNDRHGHQAGDRCLRAVAQAMAGAAHRAGDMVARYGGEEFAFVLPRTDAAGAARIGADVCARVAALALPHGDSAAAPIVTLSIGAATMTPAVPSQQGALVSAADRALYAAKRAGRNRVVSDAEETLGAHGAPYAVGRPVAAAAESDGAPDADGCNQTVGRPVAAVAESDGAPDADGCNQTVGRPVAAAAEPTRILQLEDNADDAEVQLRQLRKAGLEFVARRVDTREAFAGALDEFRPDVVLADYNVPGFSGESALAMIRSRHGSVPVIMVSGVLVDEQAVALIKAGATDFVLKDRLGRLASAVRSAVEHEAERRRRTEAERRVRESDQRYRAIFECAPVPCLVTDAAGVVRNVNRAFTRMLGYPPGDVSGRLLEELVPVGDRNAMRAYLAAGALRTLAPRETRWLHRDGRVLPGLLSFSQSGAEGAPLQVGQVVGLTEAVAAQPAPA